MPVSYNELVDFGLVCDYGVGIQCYNHATPIENLILFTNHFVNVLKELDDPYDYTRFVYLFSSKPDLLYVNDYLGKFVKFRLFFLSLLRACSASHKQVTYRESVLQNYFVSVSLNTCRTISYKSVKNRRKFDSEINFFFKRVTVNKCCYYAEEEPLFFFIPTNWVSSEERDLHYVISYFAQCFFSGGRNDPLYFLPDNALQVTKVMYILSFLIPDVIQSVSDYYRRWFVYLDKLSPVISSLSPLWRNTLLWIINSESSPFANIFFKNKAKWPLYYYRLPVRQFLDWMDLSDPRARISLVMNLSLSMPGNRYKRVINKIVSYYKNNDISSEEAFLLLYSSFVSACNGNLFNTIIPNNEELLNILCEKVKNKYADQFVEVLRFWEKPSVIYRTYNDVNLYEFYKRCIIHFGCVSDFVSCLNTTIV